MAAIVLLSVDRQLAERIEQAFAGRATFRMVQDIEASDLPGAGVVVLDRAALAATRSLSSAVAETVAIAKGLPVVVASDTLEGTDVLGAIRAGAADVLSRDAKVDEIAIVLGRLLNSALVGHAQPGRLTLVLGPSQEAVAVLSTDVALTHARAGRNAILLDCTLPKSACEAYLDVKCNYGIAAAVRDMARLDANLLANSALRHESTGLLLLTLDAGTGAEPSGVAANDITALIELLRTCCNEIVLCVGSLRNPALLRELLRLADRIEVVATQSILDLEAIRRLLDVIDVSELDRARSRLLLWDYQSGVLLDGKRMADVLEFKTALGVPIDATMLRNALNLGKPLALEPAASNYAQVISRMIGVETPAYPTTGLAPLRRLLSRSNRKVQVP